MTGRRLKNNQLKMFLTGLKLKAIFTSEENPYEVFAEILHGKIFY